ncbi:sensor histidine kinase [Paenibacillus humicola]|uniref:sensor histidine kinase n=1 Tax=Paenibacillus humicola TaxID=3110540 RepID=UPI00237B12C5|nr:HAMP domain-containing sensor histidine kinase [Paenibacillus humicola]
MTLKWKIGTKLQLSNLALIVTVLTVTALSFHLLSKLYLIKEARQQMKAEAAAIAQTLQGAGVLSDRSVAEKIAALRELRRAGALIQARLIVFNNASRVVYTNIGAAELRQLRTLDAGSHDGFLIERRPIVAADGRTIGRVLLATKIRDVSALTRLLRGTQLFSAVIGGIAALGMGALLGRHIAKPIRSLTAGMRRFSPKRELPELNIRSRDEVGELAESFRSMAEKLRTYDRQQTDFLQNVSHEMKTPLMAIQGNAEAIRDGIVREEEAEESLDTIVRECQRLKSTVDELIFLSRLDHDGVTELYRFEQTELGPVVKEALDSLRGLADQKGIAVAMTGEWRIEGSFDREKLKRAFINIAGNGLRYACSELVLQAVRSEGGVEIVCTDDGKGFAPGEEKRVFDRFYKGEQGGTGIGLAITRAIVEGHGGTIEARQGEPQGAAIRIWLPLGRQAQA